MKNKFKRIKSIFSLILVVFVANSCIEEFNATTESFDSILIIEAVLTDELKSHQVKLSKTFRFEEDGPAAEKNAIVKIIDNLSNEYQFNETDDGIYTSVNEFAAQLGETYILQIQTASGVNYSSSPQVLIPSSEIEDVYPLAEVNDDGIDGIGVYVDTFDPNDDAKYYRFSYEETHQIIAPRWNPNKAVVITEEPPIIDIVNKTEEDKICYTTEESIDINVTSTDALSDNKLTKFKVRFIISDDYRIKNRYSINVKKNVLSREAFSFYKQINEFSGSQSLFSQVQPGFVSGNVISENSNEKVLGLFEVSSVTSKRIFFNYKELTGEVSKAKYPVSCFFVAPEDPYDVVTMIKNNIVSWVTDEPLPCTDEFCPYGEIEGGPNVYVNRACGDCTVLGSNIVPEFWEN